MKLTLKLLTALLLTPLAALHAVESLKLSHAEYADRIRERLPRRLQELREACGLSMYALWMK